MLESIPEVMHFDAQIVPDLAETLSTWLPCLFDTFPLLSELFLTFWHNQVLQARLYSLSQPWDQPFLQEALVTFTGGWELEARSGLWFASCTWATTVSRAFSVGRARKQML